MTLWLFTLLACKTPTESETPPPSEPAADPYYIVSSAPVGGMHRFDLDGNHLGDLVAPNTELPGASQIGLDPTGAVLLVATYDNGNVRQIDLETGEGLGRLPGSGMLTGPSTISHHADGRVLVADFLGGTVQGYDPATEAWSEALTGADMRNPHEILEVDGDYLVTDYGNGEILRFGPDGVYIETLADGPELAGPLGMVLSPDGTELLVTNNANNDVIAFDPVTGDVLRTVVSDIGLQFPEGLEITPDGDLLIASPRNNTIYRVDIATGQEIDTFETVDTMDGTVDVLLVTP